MTAAGGKREGAGRKAGVPNKRTQRAIKSASSTGIMPLDYMLKVMRDEKELPTRRDWAAEKAAPYLHARLASVQHSGPKGGPIQHSVQTPEQFTEIAKAIAGEV